MIELCTIILHVRTIAGNESILLFLYALSHHFRIIVVIDPQYLRKILRNVQLHLIIFINHP